MTVNTNQVELVFAEETSVGVADTSTAFVIPFNSENLDDLMSKEVSGRILNSREDASMSIMSKTSSGSISFELSFEAFEKFFESFLCNTFVQDPEDPTTMILANGVADKTFSIEKKIGDKFRVFKGMHPSTMSMELNSGSFITLTLNFIGTEVVQSSTSIFDGVTPEDYTGTSSMTASSNVGTVDGFGNAYVQTLNFEVTNNLRENMALGSAYAFDISKGNFSVTGSATLYFVDANLFETYKNNEDMQFSFVLVEDTEKSYVIEFNRVNLSEYNDYAGGKNQDVMVNTSFTSLKNLDSTKAGTFVIKKIDTSLV